MGEKLKKVFARIYFLYGMILSLTSFFAVAKGATDIRMVYNGTSYGMKSHLWSRGLLSQLSATYCGLWR
jgi:hypothetical protein